MNNQIEQATSRTQNIASFTPRKKRTLDDASMDASKGCALALSLSSTVEELSAGDLSAGIYALFDYFDRIRTTIDEAD